MAIVVGITGSIATGKSTVSNYLISKGYPVLDSDTIAKDLMKSGSKTFDEVVCAFSRDILDSTGEIDRKKLAAIIFSTPNMRNTLNEIVHRDVLEEIKKTLCTLEKENDIIFIDVPLLYEAEYDAIMNYVIVVYTSLETQIKRLIARDNINRVYAIQKITSQMDIEEKKRRATFTIDNEGSVYDTYLQVDMILEKIRG